MKYFKALPLDKRKKDNRVFTVTVLTILIGITLFADPRDISVLSCNFKNMTGHNCLTCGMSRSFYAFAHLDISSAFGYHLFGPLLYIFLLITITKFSVELVTNKEYRVEMNSFVWKIVVICLVCLWVSYWIIGFI